MSKSKFLYILFILIVVPQGMLVVLLAFDLKNYDASEMAFTVPVYPWPMYEKLVLCVISMIMTGVCFGYFISKQNGANQPDSNPEQA